MRPSQLQIPRSARDDKQNWETPIMLRICDCDAARGDGAESAPNVSFKHDERELAKYAYRPVGLKIFTLNHDLREPSAGVSPTKPRIH